MFLRIPICLRGPPNQLKVILGLAQMYLSGAVVVPPIFPRARPSSKDPGAGRRLASLPISVSKLFGAFFPGVQRHGCGNSVHFNVCDAQGNPQSGEVWE